MQRTTAKIQLLWRLGNIACYWHLRLVKLVFFLFCFYRILLVEIYFFLLRICKSQYFSTHHPIEIKQLKEYAVWADGATEVAVLINSRRTGGYSISLRHTGLFFLKFWTLLLAANRKLPDEPSSHAGAFRGCRVMARFWAGAPLWPLGHLALLGHHAGLEGHWQLLLLAEAANEN